jgi:hypothetical protein
MNCSCLTKKLFILTNVIMSDCLCGFFLGYEESDKPTSETDISCGGGHRGPLSTNLSFEEKHTLTVLAVAQTRGPLFLMT